MQFQFGLGIAGINPILEKFQAFQLAKRLDTDEIKILGSQLGAILCTLSRKTLSENRTATDADTATDN